MITSSNLSISSNQEEAQSEAEEFGRVIKDRNVQEIENFGNVLNEVNYHGKGKEIDSISSWLDSIFGKNCNS